MAVVEPADRTIGLCRCGHFATAHHTAYDCRACGCRRYDEVRRIPVQEIARVLTVPPDDFDDLAD